MIKYFVLIFLALLLIGPLWVLLSKQVNLSDSWSTASRSSANIAPDPANTKEAVVQAYAARAFNWRGLWGVHTWIAAKPANARHFIVYQVSGWGLWHGLSAVSVRPDVPDRLWFNQRPHIMADLRGEQATAAIAKINQASADYPYHNRYTIWPGPNSNTYIAFIARRVPELNLVLPATAIGKDYLGKGKFLMPAASGTGYQFSLGGLLGITLARKEGLEINLLGLAVGINPLLPAINLPGVGLISWAD